MRRPPRVGPLAVAVAVVLGCGDDLGPRVPAFIAVTPGAPEVPIDGTLQLEAAVVDATGREIDGHTVSFQSSDTTILTVGDGGLLTSTGSLGTSLITMEAGDLTATAEAEVVLPPSALVVRPGSLELDTHGEGAIRFFVTEKNGKPLPAAEVTFRSSDPDMLRLELAEGGGALWVTALATGTATVTLASGELTAKVPVTVRVIPAYVEVTPRHLTLSPGGSQQVTAVLRDQTGDSIEPATPFRWSSSNQSVVTVSASGLLTSVGPEGTAVVTATTDTLTDTLRIFVGTAPAGELLARVELPWAAGLTLLNDGRYFAGGEATFAAGMLPDMALPVQVPVAEGQVREIVVNAGATRAYLILDSWRRDVIVMDLTTNTQAGFIDVHLGTPWSGALSADGSVLTVGTNDGLERFDVATGRSLGASAPGFVWKITRHPSKPLLYASGGAGVLEVDDRSGKIIRRIRGGVYGHVVSPDGKRLYTVVDGGDGVGVWNLETGEQEPSLGSVWGTDVALSPDGRFLYVIYANSHILGNSRLYIVDAASGFVAREVVLGGITNRIAMSPDGIAIVSNEGAAAGELGWIDFVR